MRSQLTLLKVILLEVTLLNSILSHDTPLPDRVTDNGVYFGDNIGVNIGDNIGVNIGDNIGVNIGDNIGVNIGDNIG